MRNVKNVAEYLAPILLLICGVAGVFVGFADFIGWDIAIWFPKPALSLILIIVGLLASGLGMERISTLRRQEEAIRKLEEEVRNLKTIISKQEEKILDSLLISNLAIALDNVEIGRIKSIIRYYPLTQRHPSALFRTASHRLLKEFAERVEGLSQGKYIVSEESPDSFAYQGLRTAREIHSIIYSDSRYWKKGFGGSFSSFLRVQRKSKNTLIQRVWILHKEEIEECLDLIKQEEDVGIYTRIGLLSDFISRPYDEEFMVVKTDHGDYVVITKGGSFDGEYRVETVIYDLDTAKKYYNTFQDILGDYRLVEVKDLK